MGVNQALENQGSVRTPALSFSISRKSERVCGLFFGVTIASKTACRRNVRYCTIQDVHFQP